MPKALLDRMDIITLPGYTLLEKITIAEKYLIPSVMSECGLTSNDLIIEKDALVTIIENYCRDPGVRSLRRHIETLARRIALRCEGLFIPYMIILAITRLIYK